MSADAKDPSNKDPGDQSRTSSEVADDLSSQSSKVLEGSAPQTPRSVCEIVQSSNLKSFPLTELKVATRNFRADSMMLGEGGFGSVYKGWIDEHSPSAAKPGTGIVVAVKRLNQDGSQGHKVSLVSFNSNLLI